MLQHSPRSAPREDRKPKTVLGRFIEKHRDLFRTAIIATVVIGAYQAAKDIGPDTSPIPQMSVYVSHGSGLPPPHANMEEILWSLRTFDEFAEFYNTHVRHDDSGNFFAQYHRDLGEFQAAGWKGPCNNGVRLLCEWGIRHGYRAYYSNLCPANPLHAFSESWHQIGFIKPHKDLEEYWIVDSLTLRHTGTLEQYLQKHHPASTMTPLIGGVRQYARMRPNFLSRFLPALELNETIKGGRERTREHLQVLALER